MEKRPWQITTRGILWATFWMGVFFAACTIRIESLGNDLLKHATVFLRVVPVFTAVGAPFRHARIATLIGAVVYGLVLAALAGWAQSTGMPWTFF